VNRVRVARSRCTDNTLTVAEKKQFVLHKEEQIAAGIRARSGQVLRRPLWEAAQQAASDEFGREIEFVFERRVSVPLSKMLNGRLRNRAQGTLHKYFS